MKENNYITYTLMHTFVFIRLYLHLVHKKIPDKYLKVT